MRRRETEPPPPVAPVIVEIVWRDAYFDFDQGPGHEARDDYLVRTVGFLIEEGLNFVSVGQEMLPDGDGYRAITHIPQTTVESINRLHPEP